MRSRETVVNPLSIAARIDDAGAAEICEMTRDLRLWIVENLDEVTDAQLPRRKQIEDAQSRRIAERLKKPGEFRGAAHVSSIHSHCRIRFPVNIALMRPRYDIRIDGRELFVIDDVISGARLENLTTYFEFAPAQRIEADRLASGDTRLWIIPIERDVAERQPYTNAIMSEVAEHFPGETFAIERAYCNATTFGDMLYPHRDNYDLSSRDVTALIFVCNEWKKEWDGETIFFNDAGDAMHAIAPRPGRLVLFRSAIEHRAGTPSRICNRTRLTLALKLRASQ